MMTIGNEPQGVCPHDDCEGTLMNDRTTHATVCNVCYTCFGGSGEPLRSKRRRHQHTYERTEQYDGSHVTRLFGGFYTAYVGSGDYEFADLEDSMLDA